MAEPTAYPERPVSSNLVAASAFPTEHLAPPVVYRRISGFAIASLTIGVLFLLLLAILGAWGLRDQAPVILAVYMQILPIVGAGLAVTAMFLIRNSEGTLTGRKLATWGLGTCIIGIVGYWAYSTAMQFAITNQADSFTRNWFKKILAGELNAAFLDTQDPAARQKVNPNNSKEIQMRWLMALPPTRGSQQRGPLVTFRENDIVRILRQGGDTTQIKSKGIRELEYRSAGYRVKHVYQISTEEGVYDVQVTVHGVESQAHEFEGRGWYVVYSESAVVAQRPSEMAEKIRALRRPATQFITQWGQTLAQGSLALAYADTLEPAVQPQSRAVIAARLLVFGLAASNSFPFVQLEAAREFHRAEFGPRFKKSGIYKADRFQAEDTTVETEVKKGVERMFGSMEAGPSYVVLIVQHDSLINPWRYTDDKRLRLPYDCKVGYINPVTDQQFEVQAIITVESDTGPLDPSREIGWRIAGFELMDAVDRNKMSEAGPGMPQMPRGMKRGGPDPNFAKPPPMK